jgi:hypothetical protein
MHHRRGRPKNSRAGCKLCKPWKGNGMRKPSYITRQELQARVKDRDQKEV